MKQKTETQRQKILEAAQALFLEKGFEGVSTADIARAMNGSKATIYNYFSSKEAIFTEVMLISARKLGSKIYDSLESALPVRTRLKQFGLQYLQFIVSPQMIEIRRTAVAHAAMDTIGRDMYERGLKPAWQKVADFMAKASRDKILKNKEPWHMAFQFKALLEAGLMDQYMSGVRKRSTKQELENNAAAAVDIFWHYYNAKS